MANIIDGKQISADIKEELKQEVAGLKEVGQSGSDCMGEGKGKGRWWL